MRRIRLPKRWKYRTTHAPRNLKRPGVGAACFWCRHPYGSGEYSREAESAHRLERPDRPQDAKRRMRKHNDAKSKTRT